MTRSKRRGAECRKVTHTLSASSSSAVIESPKTYSTSSLLRSYSSRVNSSRGISTPRSENSTASSPTFRSIEGFPGRICEDASLWVRAASTSGRIPIRSTTSTADPHRSTAWPPALRISGARSTTVGSKPYRLSQYARTGPATPAPETRISAFSMLTCGSCLCSAISFTTFVRANRIRGQPGGRVPGGSPLAELRSKVSDWQPRQEGHHHLHPREPRTRVHRFQRLRHHGRLLILDPPRSHLRPTTIRWANPRGALH